MTSSRLRSPAIRGCIPATDALRRPDVPPATAASSTSYSDKGGLISQRTVVSGILCLPPEIHLIIVQYLSLKSMHAMILMLSCPIIRRMSTSGRTLAVYVWKAGKRRKCGEMLMRTLALPEYPLHAFRLLVDVCPTVEWTSQSDLCWPLDVPDECCEEEGPLSVNNARWLVKVFGRRLPTLELAQLFPHESPEIFSNPINMAAAVGECSHPVNPCHVSCTTQCCSAVDPCGNYSTVTRCGFTPRLGGSPSVKRKKNSTCSVLKEYN